MPYYRLEPVAENQDHPDWKRRSTYQGVCHVVAETERKAREYANGEFGKATDKGPGERVPQSPWKQVDLVDCVEIANLSGPLPPEGMVLTPNDEKEG